VPARAVRADSALCGGSRRTLVDPARVAGGGAQVRPARCLSGLGADSGPCRSPIPIEADHPFRRMPITGSDARRSPIPTPCRSLFGPRSESVIDIVGIRRLGLAGGSLPAALVAGLAADPSPLPAVGRDLRRDRTLSRQPLPCCQLAGTGQQPRLYLHRRVGGTPCLPHVRVVVASSGSPRSGICRQGERQHPQHVMDVTARRARGW
jgi:hypothetical protein